MKNTQVFGTGRRVITSIIFTQFSTIQLLVPLTCGKITWTVRILKLWAYQSLTVISKVIVPRIKEAKAHGIKNLMVVGSSDPVSILPGTLSDVAADPKLREKFARELLDILQQNDFDGVYFMWRYPGCPGGVCILLIKKYFFNSVLCFGSRAIDHRTSRTL
jgi:Glycosyl hydrolases family 18